MENSKQKKTFKQKLWHELKEYGINVLYLSLCFSVIIFYRRVLLAQYGIFLDDYLIGVVKALIIGKVIMIGAFLDVSKKFENKPLFIPTLYKTFFFSIFVLIVEAIEVFIRAVVKTASWEGIAEGFAHHFNIVLFASLLVVGFTFIPFFAFKELARSIGNDQIWGLFFHKKESIPIKK